MPHINGTCFRYSVEKIPSVMLLLLVLSHFLNVMHGSYIPHDVLRLGDHDGGEDPDGGVEDPPACNSCCEDAPPGDACTDLLEQLKDMEEVLAESGCDEAGIKYSNIFISNDVA